MTNQSLQRLQRAAWSTPRGKVSVSARDLSALIYAWAKLQEKQAGKFNAALCARLEEIQTACALRGLIDLATIGGAPGSVLDALAPFKPSP